MDIANLFSLTGKIIVVTGGYGHLGRAITRGLADAGGIVIVAGRSEDKFTSTLGGIDNVLFQKMDASDSMSVRKSFLAIAKEHGAIDVLINNAHYGKGGPVDAITDEAWVATLDGTVGNYHRCIREIIPCFRKQGHGNIVNVSSMYGMVAPDFDLYKDNPAFTNPPHYGAGKAATLQLTRYFASLLGKENIRVNSVSPGPFPSDEVQKHSDFVKQLASRTVLRRIGEPEELCAAFIFLACSGSSYITGQNIVVDGGWTIT